MFLFSLWTRKKKQWWLYLCVCVVGLQFFFITHTVGLQWKNLIRKMGDIFPEKSKREIKYMFIIWMHNMLLQCLAMSFINMCIFNRYASHFNIYLPLTNEDKSISFPYICTYFWVDNQLLIISWTDLTAEFF